jgi:peptide/nickel transport system permease protein
MATYLIRRAVQGLVVLFLSTFVIYSILLITPGGIQDKLRTLLYADPRHPPSPEFIKQEQQRYGLDKPYPLNYLAWLFNPDKTKLEQVYENGELVSAREVPSGNVFGWFNGSGILTGDFGLSTDVAKGQPVLEQIGQRMGNTLLLTGFSTLFSILIALPIGVISAIKQYSRLDYTVTTFSFIGLAMPTFWLGLMLILFFAILAKDLHNNGWTWLPYFPPGDPASDTTNFNFADRLYHLVMPVTVLSFVNIAGLSRFVRASMLEVLRQDYVRTAWAKGLAQRVVILKHALRNALIPVITIITLGLPALFSGAIITETIFAYGGMGQLYFRSVQQLDIPLVMGFLLIITAMIIVSNILADVLYAAADPRIRFS